MTMKTSKIKLNKGLIAVILIGLLIVIGTIGVLANGNGDVATLTRTRYSLGFWIALGVVVFLLFGSFILKIVKVIPLWLFIVLIVLAGFIIVTTLMPWPANWPDLPSLLNSSIK